MNTYRITYRAFDGQVRTAWRTAGTPQTALQAFAQWSLDQSGVLAWDRQEAPVVVWESSVM